MRYFNVYDESPDCGTIGTCATEEDVQNMEANASDYGFSIRELSREEFDWQIDKQIARLNFEIEELKNFKKRGAY